MEKDGMKERAPPSGSSTTVLDGSVPLSPLTKKTQRRHSLLDMMGLFAMSFFYGLIYNSLNTLVIPSEVQRLAQYKQSVWMSLIMGGGALSQLGSPIVGAWSDRVNKRLSFMVYGSFVCIAGIGLFAFVRVTNSMTCLFLAHITTMVGLSVVYAMISALLNDCILPEQTGTGSGTVAILGTLGSGCGYAVFAAQLPLEYTYVIYICSCVLCLGLSVLFVPPNLDNLLGQAALKVRVRSQRGDSAEDPDLPNPPEGDNDSPPPPPPEPPPPEEGFTANLLLEAVTIPSPSRYPDFSFACLSRLLFNSGLAAQVYMAYFFRDVIKVPAPTQMVSFIAVMSLFGCTIAALPSGILSDRIGKKPVIYAGLCICVSALILFLVITSRDLFLVLGVYYGIGNIAYLSVDYAVGVASLPRHEVEPGAVGLPIDAAKDLGIFSMSATLGAVLGQVLYGGILDLYAYESMGAVRYSPAGFTVAFGLAGVFFILSGISIKFIKCIS